MSEQQLDPKVTAVLDKHFENTAASGNDVEDVDEDDLFAELEKDDSVLDGLRAQRLQQLHEEMSRAKKMRDQDHGSYAEVTSEKDVMDFTTSTKYAIVHFFHGDFSRCKIIDTHFENLAQKHFDTKFVRINVDNAPFLVERLKVRVLPCIISFIDGKSVDRLEGFERLGNTDDFSTATLEGHLLNCGVIQRAKTTQSSITRSIFKSEGKGANALDDDDDDWD